MGRSGLTLTLKLTHVSCQFYKENRHIRHKVDRFLQYKANREIDNFYVGESGGKGNY